MYRMEIEVSSRSPLPPAMTKAPSSIKKRKTRPSEGRSSGANEPPAGHAIMDASIDTQLSKDEYETGRVICEGCGEGVSFRDDTSGGFTLQHWEAHRLECPNSSQQTPAGVLQAQEAQSDISQPQAKRRRAKRTEEERIEYLRSDPYIAQFEAYRVLCACCDKWIRLRPNSTYCSIPWDAHRKSCLSKRAAKSAYPADDRNAVFSADPAVRKFDTERVLCKICETWITLGTTDNQQAVKVWLNHRDVCQQDASHISMDDTPAPSSIPTIDSVPPSKHLLALASTSSRPPPSPPLLTSISSASVRTDSVPPAELSPSFKDFTLANFTPVHESRRRNAEQRAALLRSDPLVGEVEPNRVFCTICEKWVQLRQDSSYCAYPWQQHRGKCLKRQERRSQREAELKARREAALEAGLPVSEDEEDESDEPESEEGVESGDEEEKEARRAERREERKRAKALANARAAWLRREEARLGATDYRKARSSVSDVSEGDDDGMHADIDLDHPQLAELDTPSGRLDFAFRSVRYLFQSTYTRTDELTIAALVTYLNAAMPPDKHEDFDTAEVTKAAMGLHERGYCVFEGDVIRLSH